MKILFVSEVFSTPAAPKRGVANGRILRAMADHAEIRVVSSVPWYPAAVARRRPQLAALDALPAEERDGPLTIRHPRRLHVPRFFASQAALYGASLWWPLRREVAELRPDVILSAWAYPDGTAAVALGHLFRLPVVVRAMGSDINDYAQKAYRRPQIALAMRHAARVIAVSRALAGEVEALGVSAARVAVVPTGVDVRRFYPVDREAARRDLGLGEGPLIAVPSRLAPEKGIRHFIDALATLPGVRAVLVGDGPEEPALRAQVARLGLAERVVFAGFQPEPEMKRYYSAADLVCLPSLEEGWPNAVMESFAGGCPVVASDVGGVPDQIALTGSGLTAPPGDAPGLAERLREALARDWDREATARAMESHTLAHTARRYVEICAEAAG